MKTINIAKEFSAEPAGRYRADGPASGEQFREDQLAPALRGGERVCVDLNDMEGFGSSFLEESFGGLVRLGYFTAEQLHQNLEIKCSDEAVVEEIWSYIDDAIVSTRDGRKS